LQIRWPDLNRPDGQRHAIVFPFLAFPVRDYDDTPDMIFVETADTVIKLLQDTLNCSLPVGGFENNDKIISSYMTDKIIRAADIGNQELGD